MKDLFAYPVKITPEELKNERGLDVAKEYGSEAKAFLSDVHAAVYEGGIYATGDRDIKTRIIEKHLDVAESAIKRALLFQADYMNDEGNLGTMSGITVSADGQKAVVPRGEIRAKTLCLAAFDALKACSCPLMYAGEDI